MTSTWQLYTEPLLGQAEPVREKPGAARDEYQPVYRAEFQQPTQHQEQAQLSRQQEQLSRQQEQLSRQQEQTQLSRQQELAQLSRQQELAQLSKQQVQV